MSLDYQNRQPESKQNRKRSQKSTLASTHAGVSSGFVVSQPAAPVSLPAPLSFEATCDRVAALLAAYQRGEIQNLAAEVAALGSGAKSASVRTEMQQRARLLTLSRKRKPRRKLTVAERRQQIKDARRRRFSLQDQARKLLKGCKRTNRKGKQVDYRIAGCMEYSQKGFSGATVAKLRGPNGEAQAAYRHMQTCASVWHCPVCAARIANVRQGEMKQAVERAKAKGLRALLCTFTARHHAHTILADQLGLMDAAYKAVWSGRAAAAARKKFGMPGGVRSLEATHSIQNGWHPHVHAIYFISMDADVEEFSSWVRSRWEAEAARVGLSMNKHGFDCVNSTAKVAEYIAKWGKEPNWRESDELARWHTKTGAKGRETDGHYSPMQLLEFSMFGDTNAGALWVEYALTYHGRRQLFWSHRLREFLGMEEEVSDQEAAEGESEESSEDFLVHIDQADWATIKRKLQKVDLLEIIERCDMHEVVNVLREELGVIAWVTSPRSPTGGEALPEEL